MLSSMGASPFVMQGITAETAVTSALTKLTSPAPAMMAELRALHRLLDANCMELHTHGPGCC